MNESELIQEQQTIGERHSLLLADLSKLQEITSNVTWETEPSTLAMAQSQIEAHSRIIRLCERELQRVNALLGQMARARATVESMEDTQLLKRQTRLLGANKC